MKKKFKIISLILISVLVNACASKPVSDGQMDSDGAIVEDQGDPMDGSYPNSPPTKQKLKTEAEVVSQNGIANAGTQSEVEKKLLDAIKAQSDSQIQIHAQGLIKQDGKNLRALNSLGVLHYKNGRYVAAQYLFNKALKIYPKEADLYNNLGLVLLAIGERREALLTFKKGLQINSQSAIIGANLGAIYVKEKDFVKAEIALEIPINKGLKDVKIQNNYAITLAARGKKKEAAELFDKLTKENPNSREIMYNNAIAKIDYLNQPKEGLDVLNRLKFVGVPDDVKNEIKDLENRAKAGLK